MKVHFKTKTWFSNIFPRENNMKLFKRMHWKRVMSYPLEQHVMNTIACTKGIRLFASWMFFMSYINMRARALCLVLLKVRIIVPGCRINGFLGVYTWAERNVNTQLITLFVQISQVIELHLQKSLGHKRQFFPQFVPIT